MFQLRLSGQLFINFEGKRVDMRPEHLAEYASPPLNEVAIGVQFNPAPNYLQIHAGEVWQQFKDEFPQVSEHGALAPMFETFGLPSAPSFGFGIGTGANHDRFWFMSESGNELIQFQRDRLHHNWRKVGSKDVEYPRFEYMIGRFLNELGRLEKLMLKFGLTTLTCNQAELSYLNLIQVGGAGGPTEISRWLRVVDMTTTVANDINLNYRRVLSDSAGKPIGRLSVESGTGMDPNGNQIIALNLTVRGPPIEKSVKGALDFLTNAREIIVNEFTAITTEYAHKFWGRVGK